MEALTHQLSVMLVNYMQQQAYVVSLLLIEF